MAMTQHTNCNNSIYTFFLVLKDLTINITQHTNAASEYHFRCLNLDLPNLLITLVGDKDTMVAPASKRRRVSDHLGAIAGQVTELEDKNQSLENELAALKEENSTLKTENAFRKDRNSALKKEKQAIENEIATLKERNATLEKDEKAYSTQIKQLEATNKLLEQQKNDLQEKENITTNKAPQNNSIPTNNVCQPLVSD
jgi:DNA repair exonuclease SbcCD ATPase subunit